jgi:hypothetical protein
MLVVGDKCGGKWQIMGSVQIGKGFEVVGNNQVVKYKLPLPSITLYH